LNVLISTWLEQYILIYLIILYNRNLKSLQNNSLFYIMICNIIDHLFYQPMCCSNIIQQFKICFISKCVMHNYIILLQTIGLQSHELYTVKLSNFHVLVINYSKRTDFNSVGMSCMYIVRILYSVSRKLKYRSIYCMLVSMRRTFTNFLDTRYKCNVQDVVYIILF